MGDSHRIGTSSTEVVAPSSVSSSIYRELVERQLSDVDEEYVLRPKDLERISKNLNNSIFGEECAPWSTNKNDKYVNFYFRRKKIALHRILYINFVGPIDQTDYITFRCENKGLCCCLSCLQKVPRSNSRKTPLDSSDYSCTNAPCYTDTPCLTDKADSSSSPISTNIANSKKRTDKKYTRKPRTNEQSILSSKPNFVIYFD